MAVERSDRRVRYTKTVLKQSLLELMKDRPIGKITVTEICRLADVNRNTFYAHYKGPEELLSVIEAELYNSITDAIVRDELHTESLLYEVCTVIYDNGDLCRIIFSDNGDKAFLQRVMGVEEPRIGLLNNGAEAEKGNELTKTVYPLLAAMPQIRFVGNRRVENASTQRQFYGLRPPLRLCGRLQCFCHTGVDPRRFQKNTAGDRRTDRAAVESRSWRLPCAITCPNCNKCSPIRRFA